LHVRYDGTDTMLPIDFSAGRVEAARQDFEAAHKAQFGFVYEERPLVIEAVAVEGSDRADNRQVEAESVLEEIDLTHSDTCRIFTDGEWREVGVFPRETLRPGDRIKGPAFVIEKHQTIVVEPGWRAEVTALNHVLMRRTEKKRRRAALGTEADPILLEVFNNLFMSIAEQMGVTLQNTA